MDSVISNLLLVLNLLLLSFRPFGIPPLPTPWGYPYQQELDGTFPVVWGDSDKRAESLSSLSASFNLDSGSLELRMKFDNRARGSAPRGRLFNEPDAPAFG